MKIKRSALAISTVACIMVFGLAGQAFAAEPWWHVSTIAAPPSQGSGEDKILVEVSNLGTGMANGVAQPITVKDVLPEGVNVTNAFGEGGGGPLERSFKDEHSSCVISGQSVSCTYERPVFPYERLIVVMDAQGSGGGENQVSVSGGGATPVEWHRPLGLSESPEPFGVDSYEIEPEEEGGLTDTQAGSHPFQLTTTFALSTDTVPSEENSEVGLQAEVRPTALTKDLRFNLPPGLVGNPTPLPKCSTKVFSESLNSATVHCPNDTVIGVATTISTGIVGLHIKRGPLAASWPLFSLEPDVGEPAKFGFKTPAGGVILDTSVRTGGDYGVVVTVPNITELVAFFASQVTFWGVPDDSRHDNSRGTCLMHEEITKEEQAFEPEPLCPVQESARPFLIMPTSCVAPAQTSLEADPWVDPGVYAMPKEYTFANLTGESYAFDGCNRLSFEPSIKVAPDGQEGSTPTGLSVDVHVPQEASLNPTGVEQSAVRDTTVTLPAGVALNPAGADGLLSCGLGEVGLEVAGEQSCSEAAKVGTVEIHTPLLPNPLVGAAYLASQEANPFGSLIALYIVVYDPVSGVRVKVAGEVKPDPVTGQLVSTFNDTPELPFEDLVLHFFGGSRAPLGTPALCGAYTTTASILPWSGGAPVDSSSEFRVTSGPDHTSCEDPLPFAPELTTGSTNIQAGAFTPFTMTMSREDGQQSLKAIQLRMPPGLLGTLSSVELCPEPQASQGLCGANSLIGETTVSVGLGGNPYTVKGGRVYITGPYAGAPYGLSIVNPAKAGPFDLEKTKANHPACDCLVVRARIEVDPTNAALTITSDSNGPYAIPQIIEGIPLQIKHVNVTVNRPGFTFNPTDCDPMKITGSLTSAQGASSALSVPFQVTNCASLKFKPVFSVSTSAKTSRASGASLHVKLTSPKAPFGSQANIGMVKVDLPKQLPSRLTTLQKACPDTVFDANPAACPADSRVGSATATTPVLPVDLAGPAYFVSHGGAKFPELIVALSGEDVTVYLHGETFINEAGITSSTFRTIPDVPVGTFELTLPQGPDSALAANGNLCSITKTVLVKRKVTVRSKGHSRTLTRKVRETVPGMLGMPTAFTAQNGMVIHQNTPVTVTGCGAKAKKSKASSARHEHKHG